MSEISLRDYSDSRISDLRLYVDARFTAILETIAREIVVVGERLIKLNEIREQLTDQYGEFNGQMALLVTRAEYNARHDALASDVRKIEDKFANYITLAEFKNQESELRAIAEWKANLSGRFWTFGIGLALFQVIITIGISVFTHS